MIVVEIEHNRARVLNRFMREVRAREVNFSGLPNVRIVQRAHASKIAGLDVIEFEFVEERQHLISRQVHFQADQFTLSFIFNTGTELDLPLFDDFLKSIRLESKSPQLTTDSVTN